jgi:hypothetical protein
MGRNIGFTNDPWGRWARGFISARYHDLLTLSSLSSSIISRADQYAHPNTVPGRSETGARRGMKRGTAPFSHIKKTGNPATLMPELFGRLEFSP